LTPRLSAHQLRLGKGIQPTRNGLETSRPALYLAELDAWLAGLVAKNPGRFRIELLGASAG